MHAATLASSGARVVVKVQKPGVADVLKADLAFLYVAARVAEFLNPALSRGSVAAIAEDIRSAMLDEVDFDKEAAHVADFRAYLEVKDVEKKGGRERERERSCVVCVSLSLQARQAVLLGGGRSMLHQRPPPLFFPL